MLGIFEIAFRLRGRHVFMWQSVKILNDFNNLTLKQTNRMVSTKWTYHKEQSLASNYFIFLKILFQFKTSYKVLIWCTNNPNVAIPTFWNCWSFILWCFSPVSILNKKYMFSKYFNLLFVTWRSMCTSWLLLQTLSRLFDFNRRERENFL